MSAVLRPQRQVAGGLLALGLGGLVLALMVAAVTPVEDAVEVVASSSLLLGLVALSADLLRREEARGT